MDVKSRNNLIVLRNLYLMRLSRKTVIQRAGKAALKRCEAEGWIAEDLMDGGQLRVTNAGREEMHRLAAVEGRR